VTPWERYLALIAEYPELVETPQDGSGIRIIVDTETMRAEQARLRTAGSEPTWSEFGVVAEDPWLYVIRDLVEFPDGRRNGYTRVVNRKTLEGGLGGVCILPVHRGRIVLLKHYRHAPRAYFWEVPRGFGERDVAPEDNARKELREEVGAEVMRLVPMGIGQPDTAVLRAQAHFFFAEIEEPRASSDEARGDGIIEQRLVTPAELEQLIVTGEITDIYTITVYALAKIRGLI
jgi:ADP-ribose pyrophosphatase